MIKKKGIEAMNNACGFVQKQSIFQNGSQKGTNDDNHDNPLDF